MEELREKFGGMEIHVAATPGAMAAAASPGVMETPEALVTPPIFQPATSAAADVVRAPGKQQRPLPHLLHWSWQC